jgi:hypothetical protein
MLRTDFVGGTSVRIKIWLSIINVKYNDLGKFRGGHGKKDQPTQFWHVLVTATDWARRKAPLVSIRGDVLQEGNGKLKGEAAVAVPTSGDHHEPHEIVGP